MKIPEQDRFHGTLDGKGRVTVPKEMRDRWDVSRGDRLEIAVLGAGASGYECDECGEEYGIQEVIIRHDGDRIVCAACATPEDRVV